MNSVCLIASPESKARADVIAAFASHGVAVTNEDDVADEDTFDGLVCLSEDGGDTTLVTRWLELVNRAGTDLLLSKDGKRCVPAETMVWLGARAALDEQIALAIQRMTDAIENRGAWPRLPRLLVLDEPVENGLVADSWGSLKGILAEESTLVAGVQLAVIQELGQRKAKTRAEYDVARYVRWSQDRLDQSFVKLTMRLAGGEAASGAVSTEMLSLAQILNDSRSSNLVLVRGAPGAGKSLQLRYLETTLALESIRTGSDGNKPLPFCVALGEHATSTATDPLDWLDARWAKRVAIDHMQPFRRKLDEGEMRLFLDGFNEIPFTTPHNRNEWMFRWRSLIHDELLQNPTNAVVVACRTKDLSIPIATEDCPQTIAEMLPLDDDDIMAIAERRNPVAAHELRDAVRSDPTLAELYRTPFMLSVYLDDDTPGVPRTQSELFVRRIRSTLARERDRLNMRLFDDRWLPQDVVNAVLDESTSGSATESSALLGALPLMQALGKFAHDLARPGSAGSGSHVVAMDLKDAQQAMRKYLDLSDESAALAAINAAVDLDLLRINEGVVAFRHHSLLEFFAASTLTIDEIGASVEVRAADFDAKLGALETVLRELGPGDELPVLPSTGFEQVAAKACELRPAMMPRLTDVNPWLAAEVLAAVPGHGASSDRVRVAETLRRRLADAVDVRERISTLAALGRVGEQPVAVDRFVTIPAGTWQLGCEPKLGKFLNSARPPRRIALPSFQLAKNTVTNGQYREFIDDGCYQRDEFWSLEGWSWKSRTLPLAASIAIWRTRRDHVVAMPSLPVELLRDRRVSLIEAAAIVRFARMSDAEIEQIVLANAENPVNLPAFWMHERFANPLQPVVGVSYYEAEAYCRWLSAQRGVLCRLPIEDEWEAAALFTLTQHEFGEDAGELISDAVWPPESWSKIWGNTGELQVGRPTPVGAFSDTRADVGDVPEDLFGNVFEWTADHFRAGEDSRRVCKGGSWRHLMRRAVPAYRGRGDLATRNDDDGFRVVMTEEGGSDAP